MPSPNKSSTNSSRGAVHHNGQTQVTQDANSSPELPSPAPTSRLADLVACGELPLPDGLSSGQLEHLALEVRKRRRKRLVDYIARAIAIDIHRSREPQKKR